MQLIAKDTEIATLKRGSNKEADELEKVIELQAAVEERNDELETALAGKDEVIKQKDD